MSTHNICFCREIRKTLCGYPLLSVAMCKSYREIEGLIMEDCETKCHTIMSSLS